MAKFDVALNIIVEAESSSDAFTKVRTTFCVADDPENNITTGLYDMYVGEVSPVDDDADVADYA